MKIVTQLDSTVLKTAIQVVAKAMGHEIVEDVNIAEAVITNDLRLMVSCLKQGKRVVQFLATPSEEPATGLMTSYPELFTACRAIQGKGVDGCETLITFLVTTAPKEQQ